MAGHFFEQLKQGKIFASYCSVSSMAYLPPRAYCERSFSPCDDWVEAGNEGVSTATINFVRDLDLTDVPKAA
ncbi:MAG TPA: zinc ribbon domain-containing protein [Steroidobacteraceae bacterium]